MKNFLLFTTFVLGNLTILILSFLALTIKASKPSSAQIAAPVVVVSSSSDQSPALLPLTVLGTSTQAEIVAGDASIQLVENFFKKYQSPMVGLGSDIVTAARKYQIPFGLLPAIGQCEGNLGKVIPNDSYNTWGYGIYGQTITKFASWQEAIDTVSKSMRRDYFDYGLTTPEKMMGKYAPPSDGSWAFCVNRFLAELQ
ncbi:hypothetical protein HY440_03270 [Candidatus Microgenomates bacterium]|nr:hypothetical protein [Candidatus Microgenomates bacterium]